MRQLTLALLVLAIAVGFATNAYPIELENVRITADEAVAVLSLLAALMACEAIWGIVSRRRAKARITSLQADADEVAQLKNEMQTATSHLEEIKAKNLRLEERTKELDTQLSAASRARHEEVEDLRAALKNAEVRADQAVARAAPAGHEVIHFLSRLQEKGRFLDFIMEDVAGFSDQQIGAAGRFVHGGCRSVVREYLDLVPVQDGEEGKPVTIFAGRNPAEVRFIGRSAETYPVTGRLVHRGWRVTRTTFPRIVPAPDLDAVIAPAEVEVR